MNNMLDVMPETNYQAACRVIERWKTEYPLTYKEFQKKIELPIAEFISELEDFNIIAPRNAKYVRFCVQKSSADGCYGYIKWNACIYADPH